MSSLAKTTLYPALHSTVDQLTKEFDQIPAERKETLGELTQLIQNKMKAGQKIYLNFICTHNSRRSHLAQLWAQTAAHLYGIPEVACFSGGTEATAFNPRAVKAMRESGFNIKMTKDADNPVYEVRYAENAAPLIAFSKKYDDPVNPNNNFAAIMTCSHADENCPLVLGASARVAITYDDPKSFDGTPQEAAKYRERVLQIGREMLYACAKVRA